jgi:hypothetical protein
MVEPRAALSTTLGAEDSQVISGFVATTGSIGRE